MNVLESVNQYKDRISAELDNTLTETKLNSISKKKGKVRDQYDLGKSLALITTDRQSAFDRVLAAIPFKGQVLNLASAWWFEETKHIIKNHVIDVADPNVIIAKKCKVFPIEFVVRGYITGSTSTSLWTVYNNGDREYCGNTLPEGLKKNQKLEENMLTPTTKEEDHDRPISPSDIVSENWMTQEDWDYCSKKALELFEFGQKKAAEHGMILVDTKYEMGKDEDGNILLIDEIHTPGYGFHQSVEYFHPHLSPFHILCLLKSYHVRLLFSDQIQIVPKLFCYNNPNLLGSSNFHLLYLKEKLDGRDLLPL